MRFVDTNVLLYAVGSAPAETDKQVSARKLLDTGGLALSVQVLQEFYHQATRPTKLPVITRELALRFIESISHFPVQDVTLGVFRQAVAISRRYQVSYWDGAILAAAHELGCDAIYTEDLNPGQDYGGVRVVNPFVEPPAS